MRVDTALEVDDFIDASPIGRVHVLVTLFGTLVMLVDGFNIQVVGYIAPQLAHALSIPPDMLGPVFSSGLFGVFCGYLALAPVAARVGHRAMLVTCTAALGLLTLATLLAHDVYALLALRFFTGLTLGAANPSAVSIIADVAPRQHRSTFVVIGICGVSLGSMAAGLTVAALLGRSGWEAVMVVGGVTSLALTMVLAACLPPSLDHLVRRKGGRAPETLALAKRIAPGAVIGEGTTFVVRQEASGAITEMFVRGRWSATLAIWLCFAANLLVNYFVQSWLTTLMLRAGQSQHVAVLATTTFAAGGTVSIFVLGPLMDRFQPFMIMSGFFVLGGTSVLILGGLLGAPSGVALAACFAAGLAILGVQKGMNAITVYFYPAPLRSTGLGWGLGIGRIGAVAGPLLAGLLMQSGQPSARIFYVASIPMIVGAALMAIMALRYGERASRRHRQLRRPTSLGPFL